MVILFRKLFWPTLWKSILMIKKNFLWSQEQFIWTEKGQNKLENMGFTFM